MWPLISFYLLLPSLPTPPTLQPADVVRASGAEAAKKISAVHEDMVSYFSESADSVLADAETPQEAVARCLAVIAGYTEALAPRSLVTGNEGYMTFVFTPEPGTAINAMGFVWASLKRELPVEMCEEFRSLCLTADGKEAVFDVPAAHVKAVRKAAAKEGSCMKPASKLPELKNAPSAGGGYSSGGGGGGFGGGRGGGFGGRGGGFGGGRGRGGFGGGRGGFRR